MPRIVKFNYVVFVFSPKGRFVSVIKVIDNIAKPFTASPKPYTGSSGRMRLMASISLALLSITLLSTLSIFKLLEINSNFYNENFQVRAH